MDALSTKAAIAQYMRRLYERQLTACSSGNVSCRLGEVVFITPSGKDKASLTAEDIGSVTPDGRSLQPDIRLSMETAMHLAVYRARPDITAIVHAHPVYATSFAAAGQVPDTTLTGEAYAVAGQPALAPYALMGSGQLAQNVAQAAQAANVILLQNHGVLTLGNSLFEAYDRMEIIEVAAQVDFLARQLGHDNALSGEDLKAIDRLMKNRKKDQ